MKMAQMEEMSKNMKPEMDKEVAEGLSWMGSTFITDDNTPIKDEEPVIGKKMNINEFLNEQ